MKYIEVDQFHKISCLFPPRNQDLWFRFYNWRYLFSILQQHSVMITLVSSQKRPTLTIFGECSLTYFLKTLLSHFFLVFLFLDLPCLHYHKSNLSVSTTNNKKYKCNSLNGNHFISLRICIF